MIKIKNITSLNVWDGGFWFLNYRKGVTDNHTIEFLFSTFWRSWKHIHERTIKIIDL